MIVIIIALEQLVLVVEFARVVSISFDHVNPLICAVSGQEVPEPYVLSRDALIIGSAIGFGRYLGLVDHIGYRFY